MAEHQTSTIEKISVLSFDKKEEIRGCVESIVINKKLIAAINKKVTEYPDISEEADETIKGCQQTIRMYNDRIRRIKNGETKLY